jgi:hypothetical protein
VGRWTDITEATTLVQVATAASTRKVDRSPGARATSARVPALTLWGGFASTVCWPLSAFLLAHLGWRGTCLTYAAS